MSKSIYYNIFKQKLDDIKRDNFYRNFLNIQKSKLNYPTAYNEGKKIDVWCSNDYMGMSQNNEMIEKVSKKIKEYGMGCGGTRNISGNSSEIVELEELMAENHGKESSLVFTSGYVANQSTISTLGKIMPDLVIFSDELNHASIIEGIAQSRCQKHIFRHNDTEHLEELLSQYSKNQKKIIIFESIYSMDGDISPMKKICDLAEKYNAITYIDEVHTVGIYGKKGAGISEDLNLQERIDIIQGTFGKAYGVIGGYVVGEKNLIDLIRNTAIGFIFTTALPPVIAYAIKLNVIYLRDNFQQRMNYIKKTQEMHQIFAKNDIKIMKNAKFHIFPIAINHIYNQKNKIKKILIENGIYAQIISYPTVPRGLERIRITCSPRHSSEKFEILIDLLKLISSISVTID